MARDDLPIVDDDEISIIGEEKDLPVIDDNSISIMNNPPEDTSGAVQPSMVNPLEWYGPSRAAGLGTAALEGGAKRLAESGLFKLPDVARKILGIVGGVGGAAGYNAATRGASLDPQQTVGEGVTGALAETLANKMMPVRGASLGGMNPFGSSRADIEALTDPAVKRTLGYIERETPNAIDGRAASAVKRLDSQAQLAIKGVNAKAGTGAAGKVTAVGDALGVGAGNNNGSISLLSEWKNKVPAVIDSPIFQHAQNAEELSTLAGRAADVTWQDAEATLAKHQNKLSLKVSEAPPARPEGDATPEAWQKYLGESANPKTTQEVSGLLDKALADVETLSKSSYTKEMGEARTAAVMKTISDLKALGANNGGKVPPTEILKLIKDLNLYRREVLKEFDKTSQAGLAQGENVLMDKAETDALSDMSSGLSNFIKSKAESLRGQIPDEDLDKILNFQDRFGGYSAVERAAENHMLRTRQGMADKDMGKLIPTPGKGTAALPPATLGSMVRKGIQTVTPSGDRPPNSDTRAIFDATTRDTRVMDNIRDLMAVNESPAVLPTGPGVGLSARGAMGNAAGREAIRTGVIGAGSTAAPYTQTMPAEASQGPQIGRTPLNEYMEPDPFANGLPRDSSLWDDRAVVKALADSMQSGKAPVIQGMVVKIKEAIRSRDESKKERVVADLARIAPEFFEPGRGINGKLFHPDDQVEYMDKLRNSYRDGVVDSAFLSKQQRAFSDKTNSKILPLEMSQSQQMQWGAAMKNTNNGLLGGSEAMIGPASPGVDSSPRVGVPY